MPAITPTAKGYVPFGNSRNVRLPTPERVLPLKATDHVVPEGRPVSTKVMLNRGDGGAFETMAEKVIAVPTAKPLTWTWPELGFDE